MSKLQRRSSYLQCTYICDFASVFTVANAAPAEAARMAARARRTRQLLGKEIFGYKQCKHTVVGYFTLCTTVLVVEQMHCILCTRRYRMLYAMYKGTQD